MDGGDDCVDPSAGAASDLDMALDLDLDGGASKRPSRSARFQPKMKGKVRIEPPTRIKVDSDTGSPRNLPPASDPVKEESGLGSSSQRPSSSRPDTEAAASDAMDLNGGFEEEVEEEDPVVREIDVFCSPAPLDEDTYLYTLQYVLRPSWRPYELNERCEKVRVKPTKSKIEIDLSLDIDSENYDQDASGPLRLEKQTLSSSLTPSLASYAIGILDGNQLHLNPVHAVIQLRPSMTHLNPEMKENVQTAESSTKSDISAVDSPGLSIKQERFGHASLNKEENDEPWVSLEYHPIDSHLTERYHQKMISEDHHQIPFMMKPSDYADSLYPGTSMNNKTTKVSSLRFLLSLPLEERLKKWLSEEEKIGERGKDWDQLTLSGDDRSEEIGKWNQYKLFLLLDRLVQFNKLFI